MDWVSSFLVVTAVSYYMGVVLPESVVRDMNRVLERVEMFASGSLLLAGLFFNVPWLWFIMGVVWTVFAGLSYLGYVKWNVLWMRECPQRKTDPVSDAAQMFMAAWNLAIAVCCIAKF